MRGRGAGRLLRRGSPGRQVPPPSLGAWATSRAGEMRRPGPGSLTGKMPRRRADLRARSRSTAPACPVRGAAILTAPLALTAAAVSALPRSPGGSSARPRGAHPCGEEERGRAWRPGWPAAGPGAGCEGRCGGHLGAGSVTGAGLREGRATGPRCRARVRTGPRADRAGGGCVGTARGRQGQGTRGATMCRVV